MLRFVVTLLCIVYMLVTDGVVHFFSHSAGLMLSFVLKLKELARDRLLLELARERAAAMDANLDSQAKSSSLSAATVGASLGAGLGLVLAVVMGAASALRKP